MNARWHGTHGAGDLTWEGLFVKKMKPRALGVK